MNYEEIVKVLRGMAMDVFRTCEGCDLEENCSVRGCAILIAAADSMENLQTENAALRRQIDSLTDAQAVMVREFEAKLEELHEAKSELNAMRNELCYMCGKYREAHNGAFDGCRWKQEA